MSACYENIEDIEDMVSSEYITPEERYSNKKDVTLHPRKKIFNKSQAETKTKPLIIERKIHESIIPGTQKIYIKTWGCTHNNSDSEYMAGQLANYGYKLVSDKNEADLWLLNSCTVKNPSEDTFRNDVQSGLNTGKHVVVAGCVPQGAPKSEYLQGISVVGVQQIDRVIEVVEETLKGHTVRLLQRKKINGKRVAGAKLALPKVRKNPLIEIIPINTGCLNQCTYCKTKHARGDLVSYPVEEIIERAKQAFDEGCCEIWMTSEDTGTYGRDIGTNLPELLWKFVEVIPKNCMLRIGMTNPPYILEHLEEIAKILNHPRVYAFLHLPVQSGSDSVLADMKREYCRKDFECVVDFLKEKVPGITIATDIICGFPTETEADFEETISLCEKYKFPSLFINQFYPRPGTPAAKMTRIPPNLVKKRTKKLTDLFYSYEPYSHKINEIQTVLVTEISHDKKHYVGHNKYYEQVLLPMTENLLGKSVKVQIKSAVKFSMLAELIDPKNNNKWANPSNNNSNPKNSTSVQLNEISISKCLIAYGLISLFLYIVYKNVWTILQ